MYITVFLHKFTQVNSIHEEINFIGDGNFDVPALTGTGKTKGIQERTAPPAHQRNSKTGRRRGYQI